MLPRRHIRIKVFQSLYTYAQQHDDAHFNIQKEFDNNLNDYLNLYYLIISWAIYIPSIRNVKERSN